MYALKSVSSFWERSPQLIGVRRTQGLGDQDQRCRYEKVQLYLEIHGEKATCNQGMTS